MAQCSEVDKNECSLPKMLIPTYLKDKARKCYRMDEDFLNEEKNYVLNYRSWNLWSGDCITIYIGDGDYDLTNNNYYEKDGKDIKLQTIEYKICKNA